LAKENVRLWDEHYRPSPLYGHLEGWEAGLAEYRQLILEVQDIYEAHPGWRPSASTRPP
jgi:hypothetical protein